MTETRFATSGSARIAYDIEGSGVAVVLLHAGLGDRSMWDAQIPAIAGRFRMIRIDMRGFGESIKPDEPYRPWVDVAAVMDQEKVDRAHVVGVSMGSGVAAEFAVAFPERLLSLTLIGSSVGSPIPDSLVEQWRHVDHLYETEGIDAANEFEMQMWIDGPDRTPDQIDPTLRERVRQMNLALFQRTDDEGERLELEASVEDGLAALTVPALVIWGDQDMHHIRNAGPPLTDLIPGARRIVIKDASHLPHMEKPDEFNGILLEFLSQS